MPGKIIDLAPDETGAFSVDGHETRIRAKVREPRIRLYDFSDREFMSWPHEEREAAMRDLGSKGMHAGWPKECPRCNPDVAAKIEAAPGPPHVGPSATEQDIKRVRDLLKTPAEKAEEAAAVKAAMGETMKDLHNLTDLVMLTGSFEAAEKIRQRRKSILTEASDPPKAIE